jgi:glycine dehydrogenase subunit 1
MSYFPITERDEKEMLQAIGVDKFDDLLKPIPTTLRNPNIRIPKAGGEMAVQKELTELSEVNVHAKKAANYLGAGIYEHFIPAAVTPLVKRGEFLTAYTPYQAEASQGTLQVIYEFQTLICRLTGMDVANASHYDGSTSLAEAATIAAKVTGRKKILVASTLNPHYREVIQTYVKGTDATVIEIPYTKEGILDREAIAKELDETVACVVTTSPNFFGLIDSFEDISAKAHDVGALSVANVNPMSLSFYASPREWGADIVCGEAQPFGVPMSIGGPVVGFFAATKALMRRIPGRIAGITKDGEGRRAFVLTLQAREQHIRREKATSNICTNQALLALTATIYLSLMGEQGLKRVGEMNVANAGYLKRSIAALPKFQIPFSGNLFNEFVFKYEGDVEELLLKLRKKDILGGINLESFYPELKGCVLVCATETKAREDLDVFVSALEEVSK